MTIAVFSLVALDCPNPLELAEFYRRIVGGSIRRSDDDPEWVRLEIEGSGDIGFQQVPEYQPPDWPNGSPQQAHLDFDVADLDEAESQVIGIGARKTRTQPEPNSWRVFLDPAGHPFCLCRA